MSMRDKLMRAALNAGTESAARERARCLYCLDKLINDLLEAKNKKLMTCQDQHIATVKYQIGKNIVDQARRAITMGMRPPEPLKLLKRDTSDYQELVERVRSLIGVLDVLGWNGDHTTEEIREQIREWDEQEDRIDELEAKLQELEL